MERQLVAKIANDLNKSLIGLQLRFDGCLHAWSLQHHMAVIPDFWQQVGIDAIDLQPLRESEQVWAA